MEGWLVCIKAVSYLHMHRAKGATIARRKNCSSGGLSKNGLSRVKHFLIGHYIVCQSIAHANFYSHNNFITALRKSLVIPIWAHNHGGRLQRVCTAADVRLFWFCLSEDVQWHFFWVLCCFGIFSLSHSNSSHLTKKCLSTSPLSHSTHLSSSAIPILIHKQSCWSCPQPKAPSLALPTCQCSYLSAFNPFYTISGYFCLQLLPTSPAHWSLQSWTSPLA